MAARSSWLVPPDAAEALRPIAGEFAFVVFASGIIGTGLLAIPVLAGSPAYAVGEASKWPVGLSRDPEDAVAFYSTLAAADVLGIGLPSALSIPSRHCSGPR
jgi:Mn2+/Fe2+ NRAMP family transporter